MRGIILTQRFLRSIIGNELLGLVGYTCIVAVEIDDIGTVVVVVLFGEAQTQLGDAFLIDELEIGGIKFEGAPVVSRNGGNPAWGSILSCLILLHIKSPKNWGQTESLSPVML